jgi:hypothetical protein
MALVRERTIPTERPPLVGEVSANFCGWRGVAGSVRRIPYGRNIGFQDLKLTNYMALVRERTIPTERPPLVGEVSETRHICYPVVTACVDGR